MQDTTCIQPKVNLLVAAAIYVANLQAIFSSCQLARWHH